MPPQKQQRRGYPKPLSTENHVPWPPEDAPKLLARWKELGCPDISLGPGSTITDLSKWLSPALVLRGNRDDYLARVREFLKADTDLPE